MEFETGDLVHVAKDLGQGMGHFTADVDAIVIERKGDSYGLYLKGRGECWWYYGSQLTLVEPRRRDLLQVWKAEVQAEREKKGDLDWIFDNGPAVLGSAHGSTVSALAACLGVTDLWGGSGEGFVYYANAVSVLALARPFLMAGDKAGWLAHCESLKSGRELATEEAMNHVQVASQSK